MRALYKIRDDIQTSIDYIVNPEDYEEPPLPLDELEIEAKEKIKNCFWAINKLRGEVLGAKPMLEAMKAYIKSREDAVAKIEDDIRFTMEVMLLEKIDDPDCKIKISAKGVESVQITDENVIPKTFKVHVPESWKIDKNLIKKAFKEGKTVDGVKLVEGKRRLTYPKPKA